MADTHENDDAPIFAEDEIGAIVALAEMCAYINKPFWWRVDHPAVNELMDDLNDARHQIMGKFLKLNGEIVEHSGDQERVSKLELYQMSLVDIYAAMAFRVGYCRSEAMREPNDDKVLDEFASTHRMIRDWISENFVD